MFREVADIQMLEARIAEMEKELEQFTADGARVDKFIALVRKYTKFEELTNSMLHELAENTK